MPLLLPVPNVRMSMSDVKTALVRQIKSHALSSLVVGWLVVTTHSKQWMQQAVVAASRQYRGQHA